MDSYILIDCESIPSPVGEHYDRSGSSPNNVLMQIATKAYTIDLNMSGKWIPKDMLDPEVWLTIVFCGFV